MDTKHWIAVALVTSVFIGGAAVVVGGPEYRGGNVGVDKASRQSTQTDLNVTETDDLQFMREEEKLARDVYLTLDRQWGDQTRVFSRIAVSEEKHTSTIDFLLDKFGVEDPVVNDSIGVFTNQKLQALYNDLIAKGSDSLLAALYVGALIEEKDMRDIMDAMERTDERAINLAYSNLLDGSKSHLRAFVRVIQTQGLSYEAQVLSQEEVDLILNDESRVAD